MTVTFNFSLDFLRGWLWRLRRKRKWHKPQIKEIIL